MPSPAVIAWFQILLGLGGAWFALFIIWPSIRRQTKLGERIDELIDKAHKKLDSGVDGKRISIEDFVKCEPKKTDEL